MPLYCFLVLFLLILGDSCDTDSYRIEMRMVVEIYENYSDNHLIAERSSPGCIIRIAGRAEWCVCVPLLHLGRTILRNMGKILWKMNYSSNSAARGFRPILFCAFFKIFRFQKRRIEAFMFCIVSQLYNESKWADLGRLV